MSHFLDGKEWMQIIITLSHISSTCIPLLTNVRLSKSYIKASKYTTLSYSRPCRYINSFQCGLNSKHIQFLWSSTHLIRNYLFQSTQDFSRCKNCVFQGPKYIWISKFWFSLFSLMQRYQIFLKTLLDAILQMPITKSITTISKKLLANWKIATWRNLGQPVTYQKKP